MADAQLEAWRAIRKNGIEPRFSTRLAQHQHVITAVKPWPHVPFSKELGREKSATKLRITAAPDLGDDVGSLISGLYDAPPRANFAFFWDFLSAFMIKSSGEYRRVFAIGALMNLESRAML
jgi:hypothetical protein